MEDDIIKAIKIKWILKVTTAVLILIAIGFLSIFMSTRLSRFELMFIAILMIGTVAKLFARNGRLGRGWSVALTIIIILLIITIGAFNSKNKIGNLYDTLKQQNYNSHSIKTLFGK